MLRGICKGFLLGLKNIIYNWIVRLKEDILKCFYKVKCLMF